MVMLEILCLSAHWLLCSFHYKLFSSDRCFFRPDDDGVSGSLDVAFQLMLATSVLSDNFAVGLQSLFVHLAR